VRGVNPISGLISCPDCNYSGFPIEVKASGFSKMKFKKRKINSLDYRETGVKTMRTETSIGILLVILSMVGLLLAPFTSMLILLIGVFLILYGLFSKNPKILGN